MKLLIVTQRVDRGDPILGFFHRWLEEFARHCESLTVIGQAVGDHQLPSNVRVLSLRKESGAFKASQVCRFLSLLRKHRREYDAVLVHMTPVWVVIGWPLLPLLRKPLYLWYEIRRGGWVLRCALRHVRKVFSATTDGLPFPSSKNVVLGHGIDTTVFSPGTTADRDPHSLVTVGRLTRIKRHELFLQALASLPPPYRLSIAGGTITTADERYRAELEAFIGARNLQDRVSIRFLRHEELPALLRRAGLYLHAGGGGLDKALLEAMACGCAVVSASEASASLLPPQCRATPEDFTQKVRAALDTPLEERERLGKALRQEVLDHHDLAGLIRRLAEEMRG
ncbi:MAG: glycosyltransferase family 4 protein [Candidatus Peribacteraceae bacterium]|jgi:glycosyltransferase involved in cell wall biosynthesis